MSPRSPARSIPAVSRAASPSRRSPSPMGRPTARRRRSRPPGRPSATSTSSPSPARRSRSSAPPARASRRPLALLHRAFDPLLGRITIDGIDIRDLPLDALRRNIGVVFQEPMLFARSIEENLRIGKPDATAAEIARALELAQADDFRRAPGARPAHARGRARPARSPAASDSVSPSPARC